MKQVFRRVIDRKGRIVVEEVPVPTVGEYDVLIDTRASAISTGTETATLNKTLPELVKQTLSDPWMRQAVRQIMASGGILNTLDRVHDEMIALREIGYSGAGVVLKTGTAVTEIRPGDRVAFAGHGHAEVAQVSRNQCVTIPEGVSFEEGAFATVGAIALQGVRRAGVEIGERVAVIGLGLVGQLVAQLVQAAGAECIAIEPHAGRRELAESLGIRTTVDPTVSSAVDQVNALTGRAGADRVLICASGRDPSIANDALKMCRQQGRVTVVGIVPMDLERMPFFLKELDFAFSRAYGPGPFDSDWETGRTQYAPHYVRWDAGRNMRAFLDQISTGRVQLNPLITKRYSLVDAQAAYADLGGGHMASVFIYDAIDERVENSLRPLARRNGSVRPSRVPGDVNIGLIGCGSHTRRVLLPALAKVRGARLRAIAASSATNSLPMGEKYKADYLSTDYSELLADDEIDAVIITTRHDLHGPLTIAALESGKHVLVEKPLAMTVAECLEIERLAIDRGLHCVVGHNRRYAPLTRWLLEHRPKGVPAFMHCQVCIRPVPASHWTLNPTEGGGRLLGEADHFFDLLNLFADSRPVSVYATAHQLDGQPLHDVCNFSVQVTYENGSIATLQYIDAASPTVARERLEVSCGGVTLRLSDFCEAEIISNRKRRKHARPDMGHSEQLRTFIRSISTDTAAYPLPHSGTDAALTAHAALQSRLTAHPVPLTSLQQQLAHSIPDTRIDAP